MIICSFVDMLNIQIFMKQVDYMWIFSFHLLFCLAGSLEFFGIISYQLEIIERIINDEISSNSVEWKMANFKL